MKACKLLVIIEKNTRRGWYFSKWYFLYMSVHTLLVASVCGHLTLLRFPDLVLPSIYWETL